MATSSRLESPESRASPSELNRRVELLRLPQRVEQRSTGNWVGWLLSMVMVAVLVFLATREWDRRTGVGVGAPATELDKAGASASAPASQPKAGGESAQTPAVAAPQPAAQPGEYALESKGYVVPAHQILVTPQVSGRLLKLAVEEGMRVKRGQVLGEIEKIEYESEVQRAEAALESSRQRLLELERGNRVEEISQVDKELAEITAQLPQLEADFRRTGELRAKGSVAEQDYEKAESSFRAMQRRSERVALALKLMRDGPRPERIAAARAEVKQLEAELIKARWKLENCTVRAPQDGTILKKNAEEGNIVNPIAFNGSYSLCEMADLSDLEVDLNIQERDISRVYVGQLCQVRAEAFPDRVYQGTVSRLMPIADRAKGAIPVRVKLSVPADEEGVYLKPEMSAVVAFLRGEKRT